MDQGDSHHIAHGLMHFGELLRNGYTRFDPDRIGLNDCGSKSQREIYLQMI
jgi:hypothetical protein